jgi:hypothetical protein
MSFLGPPSGRNHGFVSGLAIPVVAVATASTATVNMETSSEMRRISEVS